MPNRNQIQEQYEEAMIALLMDGVAEEEGRELLEQAEMLNRDPNAAVPQKLDQRCRKIIGKAGQKERWVHARQWTLKALRRVVMVAILAGMLFAVAYAAFPEVRVGFLNLVLTVNEDSTDLSVQPGALDNKEKLDSILYRYTLPEVPKEYDQKIACDEESWIRMYWYETEEGDIIRISLTQGEESTNYGIDTEDAVVDNVVINGFDGICAEKNGTVQLAWADTERMVFISVYSTEFDKKTVLELAKAIKFMDQEK